MNYNSKRGGEIIDLLQNMLSVISELAKKTQNFNQLEELLPLMTELRKADIDSKEITQSLKVISEMLPKLKGKILPSNRGAQSVFEVYDRMISHLALELNKLNSEFDDITKKSEQIQSYQEEQMKSQTAAIIKQIEEILAINKKVVINTIKQKRKYFLNSQDSNHYLHRVLQQEIKKKGFVKQKLEECKYQFGQFRSFYNLYQSKSQTPQLKIDLQRLENGKETGMNEEVLHKLQIKIQLEKRKKFLLESGEHIHKQYQFVMKNLKKFDKLYKTLGKYEENLFHHYFSWGKRLKILLETVLIKLSSFERNKLNTKEEQTFLSLCKEVGSKYESMLENITNALT